MSLHKYGWKPDKPDIRDKNYAAIKPRTFKSVNLPSVFDLRETMPPIRNQGNLGSCTGQSAITAAMFTRMKQNEVPAFVPSALFNYYNTRAAEGTIKEDSGAEIRNAIKAIAKMGFCPEEEWPYVEDKFKKRPPASAYKSASQYKAFEYYRLNNENITELKTCIASGFPFVFGFTVYTTIEKADTNGGIIPMPTLQDSTDGGHAVVCCGYDDTKKLFTIHNSWGTEVGDKGYYYMPYEYVTNTQLSDDFWTIRKIQETDNK